MKDAKKIQDLMKAKSSALMGIVDSMKKLELDKMKGYKKKKKKDEEDEEDKPVLEIERED